MHSTKSVCLLVRGTEDSTDSRGAGLQGRRHVVLNVEVVVQQRHGVDGCNGVRRLCLSAALEDDFVGSLSLGAEGGVLQGCNAGVGRQGIEKDILKNSKRPNGVMIAVFLMSSGAMGIWWYPRTRSITEKIVAPAVAAVKEWMCGSG